MRENYPCWFGMTHCGMMLQVLVWHSQACTHQKGLGSDDVNSLASIGMLAWARVPTSCANLALWCFAGLDTPQGEQREGDGVAGSRQCRPEPQRMCAAREGQRAQPEVLRGRAPGAHGCAAGVGLQLLSACWGRAASIRRCQFFGICMQHGAVSCTHDCSCHDTGAPWKSVQSGSDPSPNRYCTRVLVCL